MERLEKNFFFLARPPPPYICHGLLLGNFSISACNHTPETFFPSVPTPAQLSCSVRRGRQHRQLYSSQSAYPTPEKSCFFSLHLPVHERGPAGRFRKPREKKEERTTLASQHSDPAGRFRKPREKKEERLAILVNILIRQGEETHSSGRKGHLTGKLRLLQ